MGSSNPPPRREEKSMAKKRAVAYVRVSSGSDAQLHSFDFQAEYWTTTIAEEPDVELVGIYAD